MKTCEEFTPLLSAFFDGELTEEERAKVLAHLDECAACRARLAEYAAMQEELLKAFAEEDAPEGFAEGVMAAVRAETTGKVKKTGKRAWRRLMPAAACAAVVILVTALFPRMNSMDNAASADSAAPQSAEDDARIRVENSSAAGTEEAAEDMELADGYYELPHGSAYYDALTNGGEKRSESADMQETEDMADDSLVYSCEPREIGGEEGLLWVEENGAVLLALYGEGTTEYVAENGGVEADDAGYWYLPVSALFTLPDDISLSDTQATALAEIPEEAEWVIVYPDDYNEVSQR